MTDLTLATDTLAAGQGANKERIAVVDIGSNSVRLVVYDFDSRVLIPHVNEKVFCGLGRSLSATGRLDPDGVQLAIAALERFKALIEILKAGRVEAVATAAVRDASDGAAFKAHAEERLGSQVRILEGDEEARYSALGVIYGIPDAKGIVGDLGGGSLELVEVADGKIGSRATLPLGPLRLLGLDLGTKALRDYVDKELKRIAWLRNHDKPLLYLVGGSWRSLARLHLRHAGQHAVKIPHQYTLRSREALELRQFVPGKKQLEKIDEADRHRREGLVMAALVLEQFIELTRAPKIVVSSYGLREGIVAEAQGLAVLRQDPLVEGARELCRVMSRDAALPEELIRFTAPLFAWEKPGERRLRVAACWLADIAWRVHPEYRANVAFWRILGEQFVSLAHDERVFLAAAIFERYPGGNNTMEIERVVETLPEGAQANARVLGRALRVGMTLCGGSHGTLPRCQLMLKKSQVGLDMPPDLRRLLDETIQKRLVALGDAFERARPAGKQLLGDT